MSSVTNDYFYAENYYDYAIQLRSLNNYTTTVSAATHFHWNSLIRFVLVILLRIGFVFVQIGSVPVNNVNLILLQNLVDLCSVTIMYLLVGFIIAYNGDLAGLIGKGYWIGDPTIDKVEAMVGWQAIVIASAICTSAIAGRMHTAGYMLVGIFLSGLIQPLLIHWSWTIEGWMAENKLGGKRVVFKDYAGAGVVHAVGGLSGLIGCFTLGRRMLKLRDLDDASITAGSAGTVFGGLLLIFIGLQGLAMGMHDPDRIKITGGNSSSYVYINNLLAASSCSLLVVALHLIFSRETFNHWTVMRCVQGAIAGVIVISAATNDYSPKIAIGLGCLGGIIFYLISRQVFHSALEDYCNVIVTHLVCAILGSVLAPFCTMTADEDTISILLNFSWQLICLIALLALVGTTMLLIFIILECFGILRNRSEYLNHVRANAIVDKGPPRSFLQRLFFPDSGCLYLQPGSISNTTHRSSIGSRFWKYQMELDKLEEERHTTTNKSDMNVEVENNIRKVQAPGARVRKVRQLYTMCGDAPMLTENQDAADKSPTSNIFDIQRKQFLEREAKDVLDPIQEMDEETSKEFEGKKINVRYEFQNNTMDKKSSKKDCNTVSTSKDLNESNYQLRRTTKLMDLHQEFTKKDIKIVMEPKRVNSSSGDSCNENAVYGEMRKLNSSLA